MTWVAALRCMQNINSWVAIADACAKCKSLRSFSLKDCSFRDGGLWPAWGLRSCGSGICSQVIRPGTECTTAGNEPGQHYEGLYEGQGQAQAL